MELKMPTVEQAYWGLRAMKTVALADGALDDTERRMLASVQTILGTNYVVEDLAPVTPEELASALIDPGRRAQEALQHSARRGVPAGCPSAGCKSGVKRRDADASAPAD